MDPEEMGGAPAVMPTNNWWDLASQAITSASDIAIARIDSGTRAAPTGVMLGTTNRPPGGGGVNPQAAGTPGGFPFFSRLQASPGAPVSMAPWIVPALVLAVIAIVAAKLIRK
jgi:hypothetical protein